MRDGFRAWAIVIPGTWTLRHWIVYHRREDAIADAEQWLEAKDYEVKEIFRRMP